MTDAPQTTRPPLAPALGDPHARGDTHTFGDARASDGTGALPSRARNLDAVLALALLLALAAAPPALDVLGVPFWTDVLNRVTILALAAVSLNILVGLGGLASFGHAVYLGIGGYAVGIAADAGLDNGFAQLALALGVSALFALLTGAVALRTRGVHFIMITMAFAQMVYFVMIGLKNYGGDDGLTINGRSVFPGPLDIENKLTLYYASLAALALGALLFARLKGSRFGTVLAASRANERRVAAAGFDPYRYRLAAFAMAGALCGLAGFLNANFANFVTPDLMSWTRSGELLFMVILGGVGAVAGPLLGAAAFVLMEEAFGSWTIYWHFPFGLFLIAVVLFARGGLVGLLTGRRRA